MSEQKPKPRRRAPEKAKVFAIWRELASGTSPSEHVDFIHTLAKKVVRVEERAQGLFSHQRLWELATCLRLEGTHGRTRSPTTARAIRAVVSTQRDYAPQEALEIWARAAAGDFDADDVLPFLQVVAQAILKAADAGRPLPAEVGLYRYNARRTWADDVATEMVRIWQEFPREETGDALPSVETILEHLMADPRAGQLPERTRDKKLRTIAERAREKARKQGSK